MPAQSRVPWKLMILEHFRRRIHQRLEIYLIDIRPFSQVKRLSNCRGDLAHYSDRLSAYKHPCSPRWMQQKLFGRHELGRLNTKSAQQAFHYTFAEEEVRVQRLLG